MDPQFWMSPREKGTKKSELTKHQPTFLTLLFIRVIRSIRGRLNRRKPILHSSLLTLNLKRSVTHTAGRRDGRQEGCESGYYNLHRNLNKTLLHIICRSMFNV